MVARPLQLNEIDPRLLKAVVKKQPGKIIFKARMMTRILQSGWVRAGDLVEVLSPVEILSAAKDDTRNDATGEIVNCINYIQGIHKGYPECRLCKKLNYPFGSMVARTV